MGIINKLIENFRLYGDKTALYFGDVDITYQELGVRSHAIAAYLQGKGIKGQCVAVEAENGIDHIASKLGVLLSGNYYLTVTNENVHHIGGGFPLTIGYSLLSSSDERKLPHGPDCIYIENIPTYRELRQLKFSVDEGANFCALITSGTSGLPKVVVHTHKTINEDISRQVADNGITSDDVLDLVFSLSFSAALSCIFPALVAGAALCIFPLKVHGLSGLVSFWQERKVTYTTLSVSIFNAVCKLNPSLHQLSEMRCVALGAEPVTPSTIDLFRSRISAHTCLKIAYASTETRTISQIILKNNEALNGYNCSLGKPVKNKIIKITDLNDKVLQPYERGEIVVESAFIASSYAGNAAATQAAFHSSQGQVSYRTGDMGYLNDSGEIFYVGRMHAEIKLNGIKIDLATVERELEKIAAVARVAVVINNSRQGKRHIVAFLQSTDRELTTDQINSQLAGRLPAGHQPHFYCLVPQLPQTHTDKVDRQKLESMEFTPLPATTFSGSVYDSPTEQTIIDIFNTALSIGYAGSDSSFFNDLGGDSLVGMAVIVELERYLGKQLPAYCLWVYPTARKLARFVDAGSYNGKVHCAPINEPVPGKRTLYFINRFRGGNDYRFIISKLGGHFNLVHLLHESEKLESVGEAEGLIAALAEPIRSQHNNNGAIVLGLSFQGFIAQQLAALLPEIKDCILLDTYNYFQIQAYVQPRPKLMKAIFVIKNTLVSGDSRILTSFVKGRLSKSSPAQAAQGPIRTNRKHMFWHDYYTKASEAGKDIIPNNCLFFRATRDFVTHPTHGYNWRDYVKGQFRVFNVKCTHLEITAEENSELIASRILQSVQR